MKFFFFCFFLLWVLACFGQEKEPRMRNKLLLAEAGGAGVAFSLNYDQRLFKRIDGLGFRAGLGFHLQSDFNGSTTNPGFNKIGLLTLPIQLNYVLRIKQSKSAIEFGGGTTYSSKRVELFNSAGSDHFTWNAALMYRRIPKNNRLNWRLGFTPFLNSEGILPSAAVSIGYYF